MSIKKSGVNWLNRFLMEYDGNGNMTRQRDNDRGLTKEMSSDSNNRIRTVYNPHTGGRSLPSVSSRHSGIRAQRTFAMSEILSIEVIQSKIFIIRDVKVMLDRNLADLYGVKVYRLNEQVKRNKKRFPPDFIFQLTKKEKNELIANCDRFESLKHSTTNPYAFAEQGVAMLSSVLNSERAISVNIQIMRAFTQLRKLLSSQEKILNRIDELERKYLEHDAEIHNIFEVIRQLITEDKKPKRKIGFKE